MSRVPRKQDFGSRDHLSSTTVTVPNPGDSGAQASISPNLRCNKECAPATHDGGHTPSRFIHTHRSISLLERKRQLQRFINFVLMTFAFAAQSFPRTPHHMLSYREGSLGTEDVFQGVLLRGQSLECSFSIIGTRLLAAMT